MDSSPSPGGPAGTVPPPADPALPVRANFLKAVPGGPLLNLRVHVSDDPDLDSAFADNGWDVVRAGPLSVRLRLES